MTIITRRNVLQGLIAAPAIIAIERLMKPKLWVPTRISWGWLEKGEMVSLSDRKMAILGVSGVWGYEDGSLTLFKEIENKYPGDGGWQMRQDYPRNVPWRA